MQFYPAAVYAESKLEFDIAGGLFIAKGRVLVSAGWKSLLPAGKAAQVEEDEADPVPALQQGEVLTCREGEIKIIKPSRLVILPNLHYCKP